jgi:hypothetical protein
MARISRAFSKVGQEQHTRGLETPFYANVISDDESPRLEAADTDRSKISFAPVDIREC